MMKKYLMTGMAAVAICAAFTSCSKHEGFEYNPNAQQEQTVKTYSDNFAKVFGTPKSTQTWGFNSNAATRGVDANGNEWAKNGYTIPSPISETELEKVLAVFNQKGEATYESKVEWSKFFVQQVYKGIAHYTAGNGGDVLGSDHMDWLCAYNPTGTQQTIYPAWNNWQPTIVTDHDDHINNFNNGDNNTFDGIMLMVGSSTSRFGFKASEDNGHVFYNFRMEEIDGNYYVGFDFEANGQNSNEQVARDYIYNDWIVKIVPGEGDTPSIKEEGLIICEDLGTTDDFDFNDAVFYAKVWTNGKTDITLLAAGGTLNLTVAGEEIHEKFGVDQKTMVNTGAGATKDPVSFTATSTYNSLIDIPIVVKSTDNAGNVTSYALTAEMGKAPQKICVPKYFKWCKERKSLADAYPGFKDWTTGASDTWASTYDQELVFEGATNY